MHEVDIPNALAVAHNTLTGNHLMNGVESMAGPDGLWTYSMDKPDNPTSTRRFSVAPRMGGAMIPPTVVELSDDGQLRMRTGGSNGHVRRAPADEETEIKEKVLSYVGGCNDDNTGPTSTEIREQRIARNLNVDAAMSALVDAGKLVIRPRLARGGGKEHWLPGHHNLPESPLKSALTNPTHEPAEVSKTASPLKG